MTPWFLQACLSRLRNMISSEELPVGILIPIHLRKCKANVDLAPGLTSHNEESAHHQQALLFADWFGLDWKTVIKVRSEMCGINVRIFPTIKGPMFKRSPLASSGEGG